MPSTPYTIWVKGSHKVLQSNEKSEVDIMNAITTENLGAMKAANGWLELKVLGLSPDKPAAIDPIETGLTIVNATSQLQKFTIKTMPLKFPTENATVEAIHNLGRYSNIYLSIYNSSGVSNYPKQVSQPGYLLHCRLEDKPLEHNYEQGWKEFTLKLRTIKPLYADNEIVNT